jgi:proline iminopeptidase
MYPSITPYKKMKLEVDILSSGEKVCIHIECSGNPKGYPVIYLHGGPGDCINPRVRRLYNPKKYNIVMFDQRGCGKSKPHCHTEKNTTQLLISDMEKIREWVGCDKWLVSGGSWGSSLALLYAQMYPTRTSGLILRGVYDLSENNCVLDTVFRDKKDEMKNILKVKKDTEELRKLTQILKKPKTNKTRKKVVQMLSDDNGVSIFSKKQHMSLHHQESLAMVGNHYELHHYFVPKNTIYKNMNKIKHIPCYIVNGRYDLITPFDMAYKLKDKFTTCHFKIVPGGHTVMEPEISKALTEASNDFIKNKIY